MKNLGIIALLLKLGPKVASVLLKFGKVGMAGATFASYAYMFNWKFALVIMFALGIHESGHVWAMRKLGMRTKGFYFVPFIGGAAIPEEQFPSRSAEIFVALMGPIWGLGTAIIPACAYAITKDPWFAAVSSWIALINLFNLLPINPLDGGRVTKALAFSAHNRIGYAFLIFGIIISILGAFYIGLYIFALIAIVAIFELLGERLLYKKHMSLMVISDSETKRIIRRKYAGLSRNGVLVTLSAYVGLITILFSINYIFQHVPGADIAMKILTDSS